MRIATGLMAALLLGAAAPALAQDDGYGYHYTQDGDSGLPNFAGLRGSLALSGSTHTVVPSAPPSQLHASYDVSGGGSVYVGTRLPYGLRMEVEGLFRNLPYSKASFDGTTTPATGHGWMGGAMTNLLWDFPVPDFPFRPFIGGGFGLAYVQQNLRDPSYANTYLSSSRWAPAYELIGGIEAPLSQTSRLTAMYRWLEVNGVHDKCGTSGGATLFCKNNVNSQSIDLGFEMDM